MSTNFPILSRGERDRRWDNVHAFMAAKKLSCLIVFGLKGRERYEGYLSNEALDGVVVFPLDSEPIYLTWTHHRITRRMPRNMQDIDFWIKDVRVTPFGPGLVSVLRDLHLERSQIGVVGLESRGAGEMEGLVPFTTWSAVLRGLPSVKFVECSGDFARLMLQKSAEEIELFKHAARVGEMASQVMLDVTRPGVRETQIYAAIMDVLHRNSCVSVAPHLIMSVGADDPGWAPPYWNYAGGPSRTIQAGDVVQAEIFPCYGGVELQVQMSVAVEPVPRIIHDLHDVARRSYAAGLKALRPGGSFIEFANAMAQPLLDAGHYNMTPMVHSLAPACFVGHIALNVHQIPGYNEYKGFKSVSPTLDIQLEPGMAFAFEPNACSGLHRVNIGGTVLVGEAEPIELNTIPCQMHVVG